MAKTEKISDESLMERVFNHDHQAFSHLVSRHSDKFYGAAYRMVMNQNEAEDIVQDAFLKLWENPKIWKKDKGAKFTTWFYKIVMNVCIDKIRKNSKFSTNEFNEEQFEKEANQEKNMILDEQQIALDVAMKALPEKQLMALNLCFYEEFSNREAAEIMGVGLKALESLLMRAKAGIKDTLHRDGVLNKGDVA